MPSASTVPPTEKQKIKLRPGHNLILEPLEEPCSVGCTCGGLLEPAPDTKSAQLARYQSHLREVSSEGDNS